jgi:glycerate kinase
MTRILIALDSFKGSIESQAAGDALADGLRSAGAAGEINVLPVADGGEGLVNGVRASAGGEIKTIRCSDPLRRQVSAGYLILPDREPRAAVIEMAAASGLPLLDPSERNPLNATSYGTGELIRDALASGAEDIIVGIGGSATVDGGMGMASALGVRFFDPDGHQLNGSGGELSRVSRVDFSGLIPIGNARIRVACDVVNPLLGPTGAAAVYGPQKGATPAMVETLEKGLSTLFSQIGIAIERDASQPNASIVRDGASVRNAIEMPGSGAAGGIGAMLAVLYGATLASGARLTLELVGFQSAVQGASLLITGEGRMDGQTSNGKAPFVAASIARESGARCIGVCGQIGVGAETLIPRPFDSIHSLLEIAESETDAINNPAKYLKRLGIKLVGQGIVERD